MRPTQRPISVSRCSFTLTRVASTNLPHPLQSPHRQIAQLLIGCLIGQAISLLYHHHHHHRQLLLLEVKFYSLSLAFTRIRPVSSSTRVDW